MKYRFSTASFAQPSWDNERAEMWERRLGMSSVDTAGRRSPVDVAQTPLRGGWRFDPRSIMQLRSRRGCWDAVMPYAWDGFRPARYELRRLPLTFA